MVPFLSLALRYFVVAGPSRARPNRAGQQKPFHCFRWVAYHRFATLGLRSVRYCRAESRFLEKDLVLSALRADALSPVSFFELSRVAQFVRVSGHWGLCLEQTIGKGG
jgi:hypothetical protein